MIAVFKRELNMYFHGTVAYLFAACLLVFVGAASVLYNVSSSMANFEYVIGSISILLAFIIPILTMRSIAEERRQRTDQLLYSLPLSMLDIVLGKFLALLVVFALPLIVICAYPLIFKQFGNIYLPSSYGAIFAFFMLGASFIAIGMFFSSLTENQGIAAGITIVFCLFTYFSVSLSEYVPSQAIASMIVLSVINLICALIVRWLLKGNNYAAFIFFASIESIMIFTYAYRREVFVGLITSIMKQISLYSRFYIFVNGVFDLTSIVYFLSIISFALFLCVQSLEKRRYN